MNVWQHHGPWEQREAVLADGFRRLEPDIVSMQEVVLSDAHDQAAELLGPDYHVAHESRRGAGDAGLAIASRAPIAEIREIELRTTPRAAEFPSAALVAEIHEPEPLLVVNHPPSWQLGYEHERELQAVELARVLEAIARDRHVVLASDLNAEPQAASIRFLTGRRSLDGVSVSYRDAWETHHPGDPGLTFSPANPHVLTGEDAHWALETGRRIDYVMVRCSRFGPTLRIAGCERIFDEPVDGVWGSDHFGVIAELQTSRS